MIHVIKATGKQEPFSEEKLRYSIHRAGIPDAIQTQVVKHIKEKLYDQIPTHEIYDHISEFLLASNQGQVKAKYSLKQAIMELGPTGYPFEDFVAEILKTLGYTTQTRQILTGTCVSHEIDVIAHKGEKKIMVEAKFHNSAGVRTDVQVSLYTKARFEDIRTKYNLQEAFIVTNTKVTIDAMNYASCVGMKIISWSYPEGNSLRDIIEKYKLHPITALSSLTESQKKLLTDHHIVLCKKLVEDPSTLDIFSISQEQKEVILSEAQYVSSS